MRTRELSANERAYERAKRAHQMRMIAMAVLVLIGIAATAWSGRDRAGERALADKQVELLRAQLRDAKARGCSCLEAAP